MSSTSQKSDLRKIIAKKRKMVHQQFDAGIVDFEKIAQKIIKLTANRNPKIAVYSAMYSEFDIKPLRDALIKAGAKILMPVTIKEAKPLEFREYLGDDRLAPDIYKIPSPDESCPAHHPDVIMMPLMGFDLNGNRLGYGGGFYDRSLEKLEQSGHPVIKIACAYDVQQVDQLPTEPTDAKFDYLFTETRFIKITK